MARTLSSQPRCPICKKRAKPGTTDFPFCCERCRKIDLGKWAMGAYAIPAAESDEVEDAMRPQGIDEENEH